MELSSYRSSNAIKEIVKEVSIINIKIINQTSIINNKLIKQGKIKSTRRTKKTNRKTV
jgi:hypothetical protein